MAVAKARHGVPAVGMGLAESGSIVSRSITTRIPWSNVEKRAAKTIANRNERATAHVQGAKKQKLR